MKAGIRDVKFELCLEIVGRFHGAESAHKAHEEFVARFQKGTLPDEIPEKAVKTGGQGVGVANLLKDSGLTASTSDAIRMIRQGAARMDGEKITDPKQRIPTGTVAIFQIGKRRIARVSVD